MKRVEFIAVAAASMLLCGCESSWNPFAPGASDAIRVASYNIRLGTGDRGTPNAWTERILDALPLNGLQRIGKLSFHIFVIHSPILHIIHSFVKLFGISIPGFALLVVDIIIVIVSAILLNYLCNSIPCRNTRTSS